MCGEHFALCVRCSFFFRSAFLRVGEVKICSDFVHGKGVLFIQTVHRIKVIKGYIGKISKEIPIKWINCAKNRKFVHFVHV